MQFVNNNSNIFLQGLKLRFSEEITDKSHSNNLGKLFRQIQHSRWRETDVEVMEDNWQLQIQQIQYPGEWSDNDNVMKLLFSVYPFLFVFPANSIWTFYLELNI